MQQIAKTYGAAGLIVTPASKVTKKPTLDSGTDAEWGTQVSDERILARWNNLKPVQDAISLICGKRSGNVEIIDFDFGGKQYPAWSEQIPADLLGKLVIERSPSGGYHVGYRCKKIGGNEKLSMPPKPAAKDSEWKAYIETRGEGGQCIVAPSPGYVLHQGTWDNIQTISKDERDILISAARSLTEHHPEPNRPPREKPKPQQFKAFTSTSINSERPGDRFNREATAETTCNLLEAAGWTLSGSDSGCTRLTRPGKDMGVSGSVDDRGTFYCFTSSSRDFDGGKAYCPWSVLTILEHGGDAPQNYSASAKDLAHKYGMITQKQTANGAWESPDPLVRPNTPDCLPLSDLGNARRLVHYHSDDLRYVFGAGWYAWAGTHWELDQTGEAMRAAKHTAEQIHFERDACSRKDRSKDLLKWAATSESAAKLASMLELASTEPQLIARPTDLDANPWLFNVSNGTINLRTGELQPHDRTNLITKLSPVKYDPSASCPVFDAFLRRIFDNDQRLIDYVMAVLGHCMTGDISMEYFWVGYGGGANGKSKLLEIVQHIMGPYSGIAPDSLLTDTGRSEHPTELADLQGKRLVTASETENNAKLKLQLVKRLTGDPTIKARRMKMDFYEFPRTHKMLMVTNNKPRVREDSEAAWRRIKLIPFNVQIPENERDQQLAGKLKIEASGVLNRLVAGCQSWIKNGLVEPDAVKSATEEYRQESDPIGKFIDDNCIMASNGWTSAERLYESYQTYAKSCGEFPITETAFGILLGKRNLQKKKRSGKRGWEGITVLISSGDAESWA